MTKCSETLLPCEVDRLDAFQDGSPLRGATGFASQLWVLVQVYQGRILTAKSPRLSVLSALTGSFLSSRLKIMMDILKVDPLLLLASGLGIFSHHAYFIRSEHMLNIPPLLSSALLIYLTAIVFQSTVLRNPVVESIIIVTKIYAAFAGGLFSSILVYRAWFHRLHSFPGPPGLKLSQLYHIWCTRRLDRYHWIHRLHKRYGPVVRVGMCTRIRHLVFPSAIVLLQNLNLD